MVSAHSVQAALFRSVPSGRFSFWSRWCWANRGRWTGDDDDQH
jgi:hypothetical protein